MVLDLSGTLVLNKSLYALEGRGKTSKFDNVFWTANDLLLVLAYGNRIQVINLYNKTEVYSDIEGQIRGIVINDQNQVVIRVLQNSTE